MTYKQRVNIVLRWCALSLVLALLPAEDSVPVIQTPHGGDRNVIGTASPGSTPITIYSVSGTRRSFLGNSRSMDSAGNYAAAVNPPLKDGQQIIATDVAGRSSALVTVVHQSGPAGQ